MYENNINYILDSKDYKDYVATGHILVLLIWHDFV